MTIPGARYRGRGLRIPGIRPPTLKGDGAYLTEARKGVRLTTAIIGIGHIGGSLARHLVDGGESVVLAANGLSGQPAIA